MSIPAYLILGSPACGRRGIACDIVEKALGDDDFCCVFVADDENPSDFDKRIAGAPNAGIVKYSGFADATAKIAALDESKITSIIFVAASSENVADSVENFKAIVGDGKIRLARIWSVLDCHMLKMFPDETFTYADALSHFADCLLLSRRSGVSNREVNDIKLRYEKMCRPHIIELVDKNFQVSNPIELMIEEARRITMVFDDFDPIDDLDLDGENLPEEPFSLERKPDPYLARLPNGLRQKPIPNVCEYAAAAREAEKKDAESGKNK